MTPLGEKHLPRYASPDGFYFFLRRRMDFNRPLVLRMDEQSYLLAINTQSMDGLMQHDFNQLHLRSLEDQAIERQLVEVDRALPEQADPATLKRLTTQRALLEQDRIKNRQGQLWRNRTQMIFALKSYIPQNEFLEVVRTWAAKEQSGVSA